MGSLQAMLDLDIWGRAGENFLDDLKWLKVLLWWEVRSEAQGLKMKTQYPAVLGKVHWLPR